jgi:hypothetical protein
MQFGAMVMIAVGFGFMFQSIALGFIVLGSEVMFVELINVLVKAYLQTHKSK